jgi:hypothetical protein
MIDTDPREYRQDGAYQPPTFAELVESATQLGLVEGCEPGRYGIRLQIVGQVYDVAQRDAEMLLTGLLLGYFSVVSQDDLLSAQWNT